MKIVLFCHPAFIGSQSMPRFSTMLEQGMRRRGHEVERWTASPLALRFPFPKPAKKWLGYIDQYLLFPIKMRRRLGSLPPDSLLVFADQALGPWVPLGRDRLHVIHCHDFLAQRSALGEIPENPTGWTGRQYQQFIRRGYSKGNNFISVSEKTRQDLHRFLETTPARSEVVYNGLNQECSPQDIEEARKGIGRIVGNPLNEGYLLHVGGNQWYKNRIGVIQIYDAWRQCSRKRLPLLMIGPSASPAIRQARHRSSYRDDIHLLSGLNDESVRAAYAGATVFLFPSLAEGFGWPIAEAMASGCPVITTDEAPMTEVAGGAAVFVSRRPMDEPGRKRWASESAEVVEALLGESEEARAERVKMGIENARRFETEAALDRIESIYREIVESRSPTSAP